MYDIRVIKYFETFRITNKIGSLHKLLRYHLAYSSSLI